MRRLRILTCISLVLAITTFVIKNQQPTTIAAGDGLLIDKAWLTTNDHPLTVKDDIRPPDQTFLTYPEWFLVFSPAEQANYFATHTSTTFPYRKHIDQLWNGYRIMYHQIKGNFPFNTGYHFMIMVIAGSTTVEYTVKSWYETVVGRVTDTRPGEPMTAEDAFNANYERSYVQFIEALPWYQYDFNRQLKTLWNDVPPGGDHWLRKWERRYYLTTELLVKSAYGWLIGLGTKSAYGTASLQTAVVMKPIPADVDTTGLGYPTKSLPNGMLTAQLPRYAAFNGAVAQLANKSIGLEEIAGNNGAVMLTILSGHPLPADPGYQVLFTQPLVTQPGMSRIALVTRVTDLDKTIRSLSANKITIEHIYDY